MVAAALSGVVQGCEREARSGFGAVGTETGVPPREGSQAETDKINNE